MAVVVAAAGVGEAQITLVEFGSDGWDYFIGSADPAAPIQEWREPTFVPGAGWVLDAAAPIGYGAAAKGIATVIPSSAPADGNYTTVYFRRTINVADPDEIRVLTLNTQHDDGFVAYINGVEVGRHNVAPGDEDVRTSFATAGHEYTDQPNSFDITPGAAELVDGANLFAIEVKNVNQTSSDLVMDVELVAETDPAALCPTNVSCIRTLDGATISWVNNPNAAYTSIAVTRDGSPIAGSPFAGSTESVFDAGGAAAPHCYEVIATYPGFTCPALRCCTTSAVCLVAVGDDWRFFRGVAEPSPDGVGAATTDWTEPGFNDAAWEIGPSGFGYSDGDDATVLTDMEDGYTTTYIRTTFDLELPSVMELTLVIDYDDAFIAYLNGTEVARSANIGTPGDIQPFNAVSSADHEAGAFESFAIPLAAAVDGTNTIAIQGINTDISSSDFSLIPKIVSGGIRCPDPASLTCVRRTTGVEISWVNHPDGTYDSISVTRNGTPIAGSPFPGTRESVLDASAPPASAMSPLVYEVVHRRGTDACSSLTCTISDNRVAICAAGDEWRYFRGVQEPSPDGTGAPTLAWAQSGFSDAGWEFGPSGFGYGDGDDATVLTDMQDTYSSVYIRKAIDVASLAAVRGLALSIDYDDGFIAYFNGTEFARSQAPAGAVVPYDALAAGLREAGAAEIYGVPPALIEVGRNVVAIQGLNQGLGSSDLSLIPELVTGVEIPITGLVCIALAASAQVRISWNPSTHESYVVTRNGAAIPGSPFPAGTTAVLDAAPLERDNVYEVSGVQDGVQGTPVTCTVTCEALFPDALTCVLSLASDGAGGMVTQGDLSWTVDPPGTASIEVEREGAMVAALPATATSYLDANVEVGGPEEDVDYTVRFLDGTGAELCALTCGPLALCPQNFSCQVVGDTVELAWTNIVKEWTSFTILRDGVEIAAGLPGDATNYVDDTVVLVPEVTFTYTLQPIAAAGEQAACDQVCATARYIPELAKYVAPPGGWDYIIDFTPADGAYNPARLAPGNLDGNWIRAATDEWDGSAPLDVGAAPDGPAPGGIAVESIGSLGECGVSANALRVLDPGDPGNPGGSLAAEYPEPYTSPDNSMLILGYDTGVDTRNLLRDGVTIAGRWRINPDAPEYLNAGLNGDGEPIAAGLGQLGIYFLDDGSLGTAGAPVGLSFALNSGDVLEMSSQPVEQLDAVGATTFHSFWATVEDPEGDDTYDVTFYLNGGDVPFTLFGTATGLTLQAAAVSFGAAVGNYLVIALSDAGNDADIQIDWIAYREGVFPPSTMECAPCENNPPTASIAVTPGTTVTLAGGSAQVTLNGSGSTTGDGAAQSLTYAWTKVAGPAGDIIGTQSAVSTTITFNAAGSYTYRLTVNDGQSCNNTASTTVTITVRTDGGGGPRFRRADTNGDNTVNLTDGIKVFEFLFLGGATPTCQDSLDSNDDGVLNLTDGINILNVLFLGFGVIAPPSGLEGTCGIDPNADALPECVYTGNC